MFTNIFLCKAKLLHVKLKFIMHEVDNSTLCEFVCGVPYFHGDKQAFKVNQFKCHVQISLFGAYSLKP